MSSPTNTNIQVSDNYDELIDNLLSCLGVSKSSFLEAVAWSLCEHMVVFLAEDREEIMAMRNDRDFFAKFGLYLQRKTGRKWSFEDAERIRRRLMLSFEEHHTRQPIQYEDWLRLLFTTPLRCAKCGATPPAITLEIDHFFPSARGGSSTAPNLRFLCLKENREKSANLEATRPWLKLR